MRGFITTLIAIALALLFVSLIGILKYSETQFEANQLRYQSLVNAEVAFEEIAEDLHDVVGIEIQMTEYNDSIHIIFQDSFPAQNHSDELLDYQAFVENTTASSLHANLSLNISELIDDRLEIIFFDNSGDEEDGYIYWVNYTANQTLFTILGDWEVVANYSGNITVPLTRELLDDSDIEWETGDDRTISYNLRYRDNNGTVTWNGLMDEEDLQKIEIDYTNGQHLTIWLGDIEDRFETHAGWDIEEAGIVFEGSAAGNFSILAVHPMIQPEQRIGYRYNAHLIYQQGNATKAGYPYRTG